VWPDTTSRIWALYKLAWYSYLASRVQVSEAYMSRAIELLEATNTRKNRANLMIFYADILSDRGKYTDAQEYLFKAVRISEIEKDTFALACGYMSIGHVYGFCGNLVNSLAYYKKANDLFNQLGEHEYEIAVLTDIGLTYRELDKPDSALYYYHHALTIDSATINVRNKVITLFNIGNVYLDVEEISKARKIL
jgi:tetratricopeptide (TPR) repeat protein